MKIIRIFILTSIFLPTFIAAQDPQWTGKYFHILISTTDFKSAQQVAEAASKKTGLAYRNSDVQPNSTTGITHPSDSCKKWGEEFPCYFPRGRWDDGAYITVEYSSGFEGFAEGYFIVIAASGSNQDVDFTDAVKKGKEILSQKLRETNEDLGRLYALMTILFEIARTPEHFKIAKGLFEEYAAALNVDLCFQGFEEELKTLHLQYNLPKGCLVLVFENSTVIGCAAIREFEDQNCELKRMYLKPEYRGNSLGKKLLQFMFDKAKELGYTKMLLDTLPQMKEAQGLYTQFGFRQIESYRFNPVEGTIYLEKKFVLKFIRSIINSNIYISLAGVMLTIETQIQLGMRPQLHPYLFLIFFATLCEYNVHRFITILTHKEALNSSKHKWVKDHLMGFYVLVFASVAGFLISAILAKKEVLLTLAPIAALTLFYSIPVYGNKKSIFRLREIPYLKIFIISFTWSATTILLPVIQTGRHFDTEHILLMLIERFIFVFGITLPFDIRDMADDRIAKTRTLPLLLGERNSIKLANGSIVVFMILSIMHYAQLNEYLTCIAMLISGLTTLIFLQWKKVKVLPLYHYAVLDGTMLFQGILVVGSSYLN